MKRLIRGQELNTIIIKRGLTTTNIHATSKPDIFRDDDKQLDGMILIPWNETLLKL